MAVSNILRLLKTDCPLVQYDMIDEFQKQDIKRRVALSYSLIIFILCMVAVWGGVFLLLGEMFNTIVTCFMGLPFIASLATFKLKNLFWCRFSWLVATLGVVSFGTIFAHPGLDVSILFFPVLALPFLIFSWDSERPVLYVMLAATFAVWSIVFLFDLESQSQALFGIQTFQINVNVEFLRYSMWATAAAFLFVQVVYHSHYSILGQREAFDARIQAENAARSKGEFLANMSHEIRTPMNGLVGMIEVLETQDPTEEQKRTINTIRNSSMSLLRIIDDILDASKIEAGKMTLERKPIELRPVFEGAAETLQAIADDFGVQLNVSIDPKVPEWVMGDSGRLRQVCLNLLSNAVKYSSRDLTSREGHVWFDASYKGGALVLKFSDNGIGMSKEFQERLFQPFTQNEASTTRRVGGTGLGLVISRTLIEQMGGDIIARSAEDIGTDFIITLPVERAPGASMQVDLNGVNLAWIGERSGPNLLIKDSYFKGKNINLIEIQSPSQLLKLPKDTIISLAGMGPQQSIWLNQIYDTIENPKIISFSASRSQRQGLIAQNYHRIQAFPVLLSQFERSLSHLITGDDRSFTVQTARPAIEDYKNIEMPDVKLLVVEDNQINREVIQKQLDILGLTAVMAKNGRDGLDKWLQEDFDIVLTDCHMPLMDGFELTSAMRNIQFETPQKKSFIIAITANALKGEAERCLAAGMDDYLAKPVEIGALAAMIRKYGITLSNEKMLNDV